MVEAASGPFFACPPVQTLLGFLHEESNEKLQKFALHSLNAVPVNNAWFEISENIETLENLQKSTNDGETKQLIALLLSQVFFHLESYQRTLEYALESRAAFAELYNCLYGSSTANKIVMSKKQYVDMVVALAIDEYIRIRSREQVEFALHSVVVGSPSRVSDPERIGSATSLPPVDGILVEAFVDSLLSLKPIAQTPPALQEEETLKLLIGISLEACNVEKIEKILSFHLYGSHSFALLKYLIKNHEILIPTKALRLEVLGVVTRLFQGTLGSVLSSATTAEAETLEAAPPSLASQALEELSAYCEALFLINDSAGVAKVLSALAASDSESSAAVSGENGSTMLSLNFARAVQLSFDLVAFGSQAFLGQVLQHSLLHGPESSPAASSEIREPPAVAPERKTTDTTEIKSREEKLATLRKVLKGNLQISLILKFAHQENRTDTQLLVELKQCDARHALMHTTTIVAHSLMQRGTTCDVFLRKNLSWFSRANCWGKFSGTASLGVIHQGHLNKSFKVLSTFLRGPLPASSETTAPAANGARRGAGGSASQSAYSDGGALYALGLIHANRSDAQVVEYLLTQLSTQSGNVVGTGTSQSGANSATVSEVTQHGACLGLGLAAMGSQQQNIYEMLRSVLLMDSAVAGEAAAIAIGLVMMGSGNTALIDELLQYARDTQHEKIIRACALGVAFIAFRCEEDAAGTINSMLRDNEPLIRHGGCFTLGLAYCGTGRESALRTLLHTAVSDPSNDVRRAAVLATSCLLCNVPEQAHRVLRLLADSFNLHVRFGATLALGISCAGSGDPSALKTIVAATKDSADVVRQAAFVALGLVLMQIPEQQATFERQARGEAAPVKPAAPAPGTTKSRYPEHALTLGQAPLPSEVRAALLEVAGSKKEDLMARVGATLGLGLLEAGGRNVTCSFFTNRGLLRREAVAGIVLFSQYWHWYPLQLAISLAFQPTALIGLTANLKVPKGFNVECESRPKEFDYPDPMPPPQKKQAQAVMKSAVLSTTKKSVTAAPATLTEDKAEDKDETMEGEATSDPKALTTIAIQNMSRVLPSQVPHVKYVENARYQPVFPKRQQREGIIVLIDTNPTEPDQELFSDFQTTTDVEGPLGQQEPPPTVAAAAASTPASAGAGNEDPPERKRQDGVDNNESDQPEPPCPEPFDLDDE